MRLLGRSVRISQSPSPIGRHSGIPTGHRHCARIRSLPISRRSPGGRSFSQSRTGSVPLSVRKKISGVFCVDSLPCIAMAQLYHRRCTFATYHSTGALTRLGTPQGWFVPPNVRVKRATTAGRQARAGENVPCTAGPGLVACRWRSA